VADRGTVSQQECTACDFITSTAKLWQRCCFTTPVLFSTESAA